jgi:hypothetical protein
LSAFIARLHCRHSLPAFTTGFHYRLALQGINCAQWLPLPNGSRWPMAVAAQWLSLANGIRWLMAAAGLVIADRSLPQLFTWAAVIQ